jgi:signal transduction histidine kinase
MRATHTDIDSYVDDNGKRLIRKSLSLNVTLRKEYISRIPRWRRPVVGYIFSFLLVGAALLGTLFIEQMLQEHFHFLGSLFSVAVLFAALFWGVGPALLTLLLSTLALDYFFIPPPHQFTFYTLDSVLQLAPFIATGLIIALITAQRERARLQTLATEQELASYAEDLEATNEQLKEANEMKDRFLSIASHELKTPITTIRGQAQLAMRRIAKQRNPPPELESMRTTLEKIDNQSGRLTALIDELLDVSQIRAGKLELHKKDYDIVDICREVIEDEHLLTDRRITLEAPSTPLIANVDRDRIVQVLVNLISNAVKYSSEETTVQVTVFRNDDKVVIQVRDQGKGIAREQQKHIFEMFYRTPDAQSSSKRGLGLGLAITKDIVERHNGRISFESEPGKGSTFVVELPLQ